MKKHLFSLSLVALATSQTHAATSYRLEILDQPVGKYQTTASAIAADGTVLGAVSSRVQLTDTTNSIYSDLLGLYDSDTVSALVTDLGLSHFSSSNAFTSQPSLTLVPGLGGDGNDLTVDSYVTGSLDGQAFGSSSAPWLSPVTYTNSTGTEITAYPRDFSLRGFIGNDSSAQPLLPLYTFPETTRNGETVLTADEHFGGSSQASGASGQWVVGSSSSALSSGSETTYENCQSADSTVPIKVCLASESYQITATAWQLVNGVPQAPKSLGALATANSDEDPAKIYSVANAVNASGLAVGNSIYRDGNTLRSVATLFDVNQGKALKALTATDSSIVGSDATGINDAGLAVGYTYSVGSYHPYKFFVYDTNNDSISYPGTFYDNARSRANAINSSGLVVGAADWEKLPPSATRRQHAFVYDTNNQSFKDLNDMLEFDGSLLTQRYNGDACAAREDWVLENASGINDNGEIAATALTTLRDSSGNLVLDSDGKTQYVIRAVKLVPTDDTPATCEAAQDATYQRKGGGSFGFLSLGFLGLVGLRRRR
ncbi:DUF3466 family protein [Gallaecimonas kandeliae]|uniref:DUF3466 family protein n=1 Tax=Gallaecimonas kandeliae TaxID=3029055 RepID=UPI0026476806|nr:DUF3466 family protein [Gallaecimonas kandeliae]WKE67359.1 DUF3466 family protein [Gallaecimonas kandeliae]